MDTKTIKELTNELNNLKYEFSKVKNQYLKNLYEIYEEVRPMMEAGKRCDQAFYGVVAELKKYDGFNLVDKDGRHV